MGQHAAHHAAQNDGFVPRLGVHALFFVHEVAVQFVDAGINCREVGKVVVKAARAAEGLEQLHRRAAFALGGQHHIDVAPGIGDMSAGRVGGQDDLILGILGIDHRAAEQIGVFGVHIAVDGLAGFDEALLFGIHDQPAPGHSPVRQGGIGPSGSAAPLIQEQGVFRGGFQHRFRVLFRVGSHGRKAVPAVFGDPRADAPAFAPAVLHQVSFEQHHAPGAVFMAAQHALYPLGKILRLRGDDIRDHSSSLSGSLISLPGSFSGFPVFSPRRACFPAQTGRMGKHKNSQFI